jgi:hypothetical protein
MALLARFTDQVTLPKEFEFLSSTWVLITLVVLLVIEEVVDKIPGADHLNDIVQTLVRPASGAVVFAANTGESFGNRTWLALICGFVMALTVHSTKAAARGVINVSTAGVGAPVVSVIEDIVSAFTAVIAILLPVLVAAILVGFGWVLWRVLTLRRRRRERKAAEINPAEGLT